ncbi:contractile injection system protein, VgrG/Pvc8 family [Paracoccus fistulariae]|uniref:Uncharacterized protein n=1 Tax=Paracoccus fistulariae TaxID=658446 RepID=A0ABY7SH26_9RHOB|nr:contractile injection system protein, VgrG/Pvc8 family [Paracoccus fistulariae]MDB6180908.1 contractile injection system protein, VgrG/Pvc8 family [Paracoccus fistulariae]WCR06205.1 hypothetical protein JHX87_11960 [Paracoccus fistulariae]
MAAADFLQAERILRIDSALGADQLLAQKLHWREAIFELFEGRVSLRSKSPDLTPQDLLGKPVDLRLELGGGRLGRPGDPAHRHGGDGQLSRRRPRQARRHRRRAEFAPEGAI